MLQEYIQALNKQEFLLTFSFFPPKNNFFINI